MGLAIGRLDAVGTSLAGMERAQNRLGSDAATIASSGPDIAAMVDLEVQRQSFAANAVALRASSDTTGVLIDTLA